MVQRLAVGNASADPASILNKDQLLLATAGRGCECPSLLTTYGTFCTNTCGLKIRLADQNSL